MAEPNFPKWRHIVPPAALSDSSLALSGDVGRVGTLSNMAARKSEWQMKIWFKGIPSPEIRTALVTDESNEHGLDPLHLIFASLSPIPSTLRFPRRL